MLFTLTAIWAALALIGFCTIRQGPIVKDDEVEGSIIVRNPSQSANSSSPLVQANINHSASHISSTQMDELTGMKSVNTVPSKPGFRDLWPLIKSKQFVSLYVMNFFSIFLGLYVANEYKVYWL